MDIYEQLEQAIGVLNYVKEQIKNKHMEVWEYKEYAQIASDKQAEINRLQRDITFYERQYLTV